MVSSTCRGCQRPLEESFRVCPWCGTPVQEPPAPRPATTMPCPHCRAPMWVKATECPRCGKRPDQPVAAVGYAAPQGPLPSYSAQYTAPATPVRQSGSAAPASENGKAVAIVLAVLVGLGLLVALLFNWNGIGQAIGPSCSVGVTGSAASVTVRGWTSGQACESMSRTAGVTSYRLDSEASTPVVCEYRIQGDLFIVHDQGMLNLVGGTLCAALASEVQQGSG